VIVKRSLLLIVLCLIVLGGLLMGACSSGATTPVTTATQPSTITASPTTTAANPPTTSTAAATTTTTTKTAPYGTLTIASQTFQSEAFDPNQAESWWGFAMYDPLVVLNNQGEPVGVAAESFTLSPDGKTWTFKVRKSMKFTNGDPVTSADFQFSVQHFGDKSSTNAWSNYLRYNFDSDSCPDEYTYVYVTKTPEPQLIQPFSYTRILPKKYFQSVGQDAFRKAPIGSGPLKLKEFVPSTRCVLEANTDYWGTIPAYKYFIDLLIPEEATRVAMIKSGDVDIALALGPDRIVELKKLGYRLEQYATNTLFNITFSGSFATDRATKDIRVRQAMSYSINRKEMCDTYFNGLATPGGRWFMDESSWGWDPSWKADPYDPAKAKQLLTDAGYPSKFANPVIQLWAQPGIYSDLMQLLQGYWNKAGIQTKLTVVDVSYYQTLFFQGKRAPTDPNVGSVIPWYYGARNRALYQSANMYISTGSQSGGGPDEALPGRADDLYKKAVNEIDQTKAKQYWQDFLNYAYNMWANVGVLELPTYAAVGPNVGAFPTIQGTGIYYELGGIKHK
jgi:peptide/nickel transport system substrate-binding protein